MLYYSIIAAAVIVLSQQNIKCHIIYSSLFINDGGGLYIYIYILVQFIRHTNHVAFCHICI